MQEKENLFLTIFCEFMNGFHILIMTILTYFGLMALLTVVFVRFDITIGMDCDDNDMFCIIGRALLFSAAILTPIFTCFLTLFYTYRYR